MKVLPLAAAVAVTLAGPVVAGEPTVTARPTAARAATPVASASWRAVDIEGRAWSSEALRGRVVLVDFWATWCAPCLADLPQLRRLHATYADKGLVIVGVSLDRSSARDFRSWLQRQAVAWPQVREAGGYDSPLAAQFGVEVLPASFLFDRDGRLRGRDLRGAALETRVRAILEGA